MFIVGLTVGTVDIVMTDVWDYVVRMDRRWGHTHSRSGQLKYEE